MPEPASRQLYTKLMEALELTVPLGAELRQMDEAKGPLLARNIQDDIRSQLRRLRTLFPDIIGRAYGPDAK